MHRIRDAEEDTAETLPEKPVRAGEPADSLRGGLAERAQAAATLRLDRESEVRGGVGEPAGDRFRARLAVEGVVQLDRG